MTRKLMLPTAVAMAVAALSARPALATEYDTRTSEGGIVGMQVTAGFGVSLGGLLVAGVSAPVPPVSAVAILGTPFAVGRTVCAIGRYSQAYEGTCRSAVFGAYLGALSMLPLGLFGAYLDVQSGGEQFLDGLVGTLIGMSVGWLVVQPVASTIAWQVSKRPRPELMTEPPVPAPARARPPQPASQLRTRVPGQVTASLLQIQF